MTRVGVTGHQRLGAPTRRTVAEQIRRALAAFPSLTGFSSLAAGADQIFAREVLARGGILVAVVPSRDYASSFASDEDRTAFEALLRKSDRVLQLDFPAPSEEAYWAAGQRIVDLADLIIAIWDGQPAASLGGTGDVVRYARDRGKQVRVIWPHGATRE